MTEVKREVAGNPAGVQVRSQSSIEISFYYKGVRCRERVKLPPTNKNIKYCERWKAHIQHEIATREFDYAKHFPDFPRLKLFANTHEDTSTIEAYIKKRFE